MRAQFADLPDDEPDSLESNIKKFKNDPENMQIMVNFINDVLKSAQEQAELKIKSQQDETCKPGGDGSGLINFKNGKIINRARGMVVRIFDVICNCANTAAAPAQRFTARRQEKN